MMSMQRWDPWSDFVSLREAMNNLLEESYVRPRPTGGSRGAGSLAVDVKETADGYAVTASVPGINPDDVDITILGDTLRIRGERQSQSEREGTRENGTRWLVRERHDGAVERTMTLPTAVKSDSAAADFKNGVLTVSLPKADEAKPRTIPVRAGNAGSAQEIDVTAESSN